MSHCKGPRQTVDQQRQHLRITSLFSGIGGFELGLGKAGHQVNCFCECDLAAQSVLKDRFPGVPILEDIRDIVELPQGTDLVTAGFPCQDLSPAGRTAGIFGAKSSLVWEVFRLIDRTLPRWVLLENVPFMLRLKRGFAMEAIVSALEERGYRWAYRILDPQWFGLPQRRPRVFLLASQTEDPAAILFGTNADTGRNKASRQPSPVTRSFGFYWTEGNRGIGWAVDSVPALKGGSGLGIPSPPAVILTDRRVVTPNIADAERLQGFPPHWTAAGALNGRIGHRWRLIGNAVNVRVANWIGKRLAAPPEATGTKQTELVTPPWPNAAFGNAEGRFQGPETAPSQAHANPLHRFLRFSPSPLSHRAASGVLRRLRASSLKVESLLLDALEQHVEKMSS